MQPLTEMLAGIASPGEAAHMLADLCTPGEVAALEERWRVAQLLDRGLTYREVAREAGASTTTVVRVARCVKAGAGGYRAALDRVAKCG